MGYFRNSLLFIFFILSSIYGPVSANTTAATDNTIRIGVLAYRGKAPALERWSATADYLSERIDRHFEIVPLDLDEMSSAINLGNLHFTLTNPGNYVSLEARFGASRIATMQTRDQEQTRVRFGAVIFTQSENTDIRSLRDLKGKSFMAVSPIAFGGFQMAWRELTESGVDPFRDFNDLQFAGFPQDKIIHAVLDGSVDAATVRAETLQRMVEAGTIDPKAFRILNPQHQQGSTLPLSTRLYPEWPFATLKDTPRELATRVAQALLSMPADHPAAQISRTAGWTIPLDYSPVHRLMKTLKIGPYQVLRQTSFSAVLKRYAGWVAGAAILLLFLIVVNGYITRTNRKLKHAQAVLQEEISERKLSQEALARYRDTLEEQVTKRTEDLKQTNRSLEKSRIALRELVRITSAPDLSHDEKLARLLDTGREYFNLPVAVLASIEADGQRICRVSGDTGLVSGRYGPLSNKNVARLLEHNGEPVDIPNLENETGIRNYLGSAVMVDGRIHCTLEFAGPKPRHRVFSRWDHELLKVMAQWIGDEVELQIAHESQQRHQAEFARVSRMNTIGEMAASLAHELNQPLTGAINYCSGCLRMLREGNADKEKLTHGMENAVEGARLAANIIRRIREFVQKGEPQKNAVDLNHAVRNVTTLVMHEARLHNVDIRLDLDKNLPPVEGDMIQLEQVVLNFIRNGIDAMDAVKSTNRILTITTRNMEGERVMVSATDNGEGITVEAMPKIFDAFYTTKPEGMGIGLSISRSIIESHQGRIKARSLSAGGTEFFFEIPTQQVRLS
ncbi:Chemotaxis regulator - transmits chemoreceptor signals to flagelllar motor components CheY [hydrothermal vent metagenome]|uniref:Chemotaxis regulator - transmits chemoreceptor signals to flagelllar motor components CheY n=1 Tax=hydrothermal vent metagenome TaxID=652676 RepID=A0A3B0YKL0_9ZZZZ